MSGWYNKLKLKESKLNLIAGPCVLESKEHAFDMSGALIEICDELEINFIYKTSFDKANRTSKESFRGEYDLRMANEIFGELGDNFSSDDVLELFKQKPSLNEITKPIIEKWNKYYQDNITKFELQ